MRILHIEMEAPELQLIACALKQEITIFLQKQIVGTYYSSIIKKLDIAHDIFFLWHQVAHAKLAIHRTACRKSCDTQEFVAKAARPVRKNNPGVRFPKALLANYDRKFY
ncbi:MAG: hypothetical protein ACRCVN_04405 [Spirochaetia bacterium]